MFVKFLPIEQFHENVLSFLAKVVVPAYQIWLKLLSFPFETAKILHFSFLTLWYVPFSRKFGRKSHNFCDKNWKQLIWRKKAVKSHNNRYDFANIHKFYVKSTEKFKVQSLWNCQKCHSWALKASVNKMWHKICENLQSNSSCCVNWFHVKSKWDRFLLFLLTQEKGQRGNKLGNQSGKTIHFTL